MDSVSIFTRGATITTGAASANAAIPTVSGVLPRYVRIAASAAAYVRLGVVADTAAAGDFIVQPGDAVVVNVNGCTHVAAIQVTAAGIVQLSPVDNK